LTTTTGVNNHPKDTDESIDKEDAAIVVTGGDNDDNTDDDNNLKEDKVIMAYIHPPPLSSLGWVTLHRGKISPVPSAYLVI